MKGDGTERMSSNHVRPRNTSVVLLVRMRPGSPSKVCQCWPSPAWEPMRHCPALTRTAGMLTSARWSVPNL